MRKIKRDPKELIESKGLLLSFIEEKAKNYTEPTRRGTARGEIIGFSLKKYRAALYSLTSLDLLRMSKKIGVSYGLLRKWRTEPAFKNRSEELIQEFVPLFIGSLLKKWTVQDEELEEYIETSASSILGRVTEYRGLRHYDPELLGEDEIKVYGSSLKKVLIKKLFVLGDEDSFLFMFPPFIITCRSLVDDKSFREVLLLEVLNQQKNANENIGELIDMACGILEDPTRNIERESAIKWLQGAKWQAVMQARITAELKKMIGT